jgi:hypothetical protein
VEPFYEPNMASKLVRKMAFELILLVSCLKWVLNPVASRKSKEFLKQFAGVQPTKSSSFHLNRAICMVSDSPHLPPNVRNNWQRFAVRRNVYAMMTPPGVNWKKNGSSWQKKKSKFPKRKQRES